MHEERDEEGMAQGNTRSGKAWDGSGDDSTFLFDESLNGANSELSGDSLSYEDLDFGPSDDEVRATLQPGKRNARKLEFSDVFGSDGLGAESAGSDGHSDGALSEVESATMALNATDADPERTKALNSTEMQITNSGTYPQRESEPPSSAMTTAQDVASDTAVMPSAEGSDAADSSGADSLAEPSVTSADNNRKAVESEIRKTASRASGKSTSKSPILIVVIAAVVVAIAAIAAFALGGSGSDAGDKAASTKSSASSSATSKRSSSTSESSSSEANTEDESGDEETSGSQGQGASAASDGNASGSQPKAKSKGASGSQGQDSSDDSDDSDDIEDESSNSEQDEIEIETPSVPSDADESDQAVEPEPVVTPEPETAPEPEAAPAPTSAPTSQSVTVTTGDEPTDSSDGESADGSAD